ncbi:hypothetical protein DPX16_23711 [Anabarilius grahami]|uniref:Uncharacterized protein n=1 Tax=Anabarilius grahami TaxID=495550 RepID=A0A3N0YE66_ANAGA|nr:hypothetical protein DPX16_23711 [Anabarilius grahami]
MTSYGATRKYKGAPGETASISSSFGPVLSDCIYTNSASLVVEIVYYSTMPGTYHIASEQCTQSKHLLPFKQGEYKHTPTCPGGGPPGPITPDEHGRQLVAMLSYKGAY